MARRHKLLLPSNTISVREAGSYMGGLSAESLVSLSSAVKLEGTGTPFRSPAVYQLVISVLATSIRSFTDVRFHGLSRIPRKGPMIVVSNHISNLDPIFMVQAARRSIHFLSKKENFEQPLKRLVMNSTGQIETYRETGARDALSRAVDVLESGLALGIYPEGTRSRKREPPYLQRGKTGVARLAARFPDVPVVPMVMIGTQEMMRPESKMIRPWKRVEVRIDEPITFEQWAASEQGGGLSDDDIVRFTDSEEELSTLYRRFTDQLIETMRIMGAP
ncbi:MAG: lysophospholipid acyltransferase family protein [Candidatus Thalassarchaeum sp.]